MGHPIKRFTFVLILSQNVVLLVNILILRAVCADHAVMDSINQMRVRSPVYYAVLDRQHDQPKLHHVKNAAMNAHPANNWAQMDDANLVHEAHTDLKVFNQPAPVVHWAVPHQRSEHHPWKNARCQSVFRAPISTAA